MVGPLPANDVAGGSDSDKKPVVVQLTSSMPTPTCS
jgi:hypothetical protein